MTTELAKKTVKFDPGFAQHTTILSMAIEYIYQGINSFKNFGQKKMKFKMNYSNIIKMTENNVGFCLGCMLWAIYIKSLGDLPIEGNPCIGDTFNPEETVEEIDFSISYLKQLKKDAKYYLGMNYEINPKYIEVLDLYREFLLLNENFVNTKTTSDVKLLKSFKTPSTAELDIIHSKIEEVVKSGKLFDMAELFNFLSKGEN